MPINKETIISVFDEKLTLMQWLKTINKALEDAVLTGVEITKKGNATLSFKFTFEDGTYLESNDLVLQQGESVENAYIQNGHLYLTLTNGTNLDAGNVKPVSNFSIDASQHLIVNYADGTSQDLGAIFNGNVNISGTLNATKVTGDEIVENMAGYNALEQTATGWTFDFHYIGICKNGNKLTFAVSMTLTKTSAEAEYNPSIVNFGMPSSIGAKLVPVSIGGYDFLSAQKVTAFKSVGGETQDIKVGLRKTSNTWTYCSLYTAGATLTLDTPYFVRFDITFLLSDNLAQ